MTDNEKNEINKVLAYQDVELKELEKNIEISNEIINKRIDNSKMILSSLGKDSVVDTKTQETYKPKTLLKIPSWDELCIEANKVIKDDIEIECLFTENEIKENKDYILLLNEQYNSIHRLDKYDYIISGSAAIFSAALNFLLVGIPQRTPDGLKGGALEDWLRRKFKDIIPKDLDKKEISKVTFDAQDNRNTIKTVEGLSAYYHRLLELGHNPSLIGFIVGMVDIFKGTMTTIDKKGKLVIQVIDVYSDRKAKNIFEAMCKEIVHLASDVNTEMGLPAPLMSLFNLLQVGDIEGQTIAEIVQGMYYEGYDFIHFCSQSICIMVLEVIVRLAYSIRKIRAGNKIKDSLPLSLNREKNPKLATMLWIAHSGCTAINGGQVYFTENPMAINYAEWLAFAKYTFSQAKWILYDKPELRDKYVRGIISNELMAVYEDIDILLLEYSREYNVIFS